MSGPVGFVDRTGDLVIPAAIDYAHSFSEGLAVFKAENRRFGYIDRTGAVAIPPVYLRAEDFRDGRALVETSRDVYAFIDPKGSTVFPLPPDVDASDPPRFEDGLAVLEAQSPVRHARVVDVDGRIVLESPYPFVRSFSDGLAAARTHEDRWGFIDLKGHAAIPPRFDFAWGFEDGLALVTERGTERFIDREGKTVLESKWDDVDYFSEGLARVKVKGKYGYVDRSGKLVIPAVWDDPEGYSSFRDGLAMVAKEVGGVLHRGWIDKTGRVVREPSSVRWFPLPDPGLPAPMKEKTP